MTYEESFIVERAAEAAERISAVANMIARGIDVTGERHIALCLEALEEMADDLARTLTDAEKDAAAAARISKAAGTS